MRAADRVTVRKNVLSHPRETGSLQRLLDRLLLREARDLTVLSATQENRRLQNALQGLSVR